MIVFGRSGNKYVFYVQSETVNTDRITNAIIDIEVVKKRGGKKIFLEVAENNVPARALYEHNGYVQVGVRPKYYDGTDAILMEKIL